VERSACQARPWVQAPSRLPTQAVGFPPPAHPSSPANRAGPSNRPLGSLQARGQVQHQAGSARRGIGSPWLRSVRAPGGSSPVGPLQRKQAARQGTWLALNCRAATCAGRSGPPWALNKQQPLKAVPPDPHNAITWAMDSFKQEGLRVPGSPDAPRRSQCGEAKDARSQSSAGRLSSTASENPLCEERIAFQGGVGPCCSVPRTPEITVAAWCACGLFVHQGPAEPLKGPVRFSVSRQGSAEAAPSPGQRLPWPLKVSELVTLQL